MVGKLYILIPIIVCRIENCRKSLKSEKKFKSVLIKVKKNLICSNIYKGSLIVKLTLLLGTKVKKSTETGDELLEQFVNLL